MSPPITLLIVDDHFVVRSGLSAALEIEDDLHIVGKIKRAEEVLEAFERLQPKVVLMDLRLPGMDGIRATFLLKERFPQAQILIYSTYTDEKEIRAALEAGAMGFLPKSASRTRLIEAIHHVAAGGNDLPAFLSRQIPQQESLSTREREILRSIAQGQTNKQIAGAFDVSEDHIKRQVSAIIKKLQVHDRAQATAEAIRRGIIS